MNTILKDGPLFSVLMRLEALARADDSLRAAFIDLAKGMIDWLGEKPATQDISTGRADGVNVPVPPVEVSTLVPVKKTVVTVRVPLPALDIGSLAPRRAETTPDFDFASPGIADADLVTIEQRCRLKAEACRWQVERRQLQDQGADHRTHIGPRDHDIIDRARALPNCFLWMCSPDGPSPADPGQWEMLSLAFDTLADCLNLTRLKLVDQAPSEWPELLHLLAESQAIIRVLVDDLDGKPDLDQHGVYNWLRDTTYRHHVFLSNHMRRDERPDTSLLDNLSTRVNEMADAHADRTAHARLRESTLKKIRYHARHIADNRTGPTDWKTVLDGVTQLVRDSLLRPSSVELRDVLLPVVDFIPIDLELTPEFNHVLRELDRYHAERTEPQLLDETTRVDPVVASARTLLKGSTVVLIGGQCYPHARETLRTRLELKDVDWIDTREHQSVSSFESHVARPDVSVVLLLIRWSSHSFGDVNQFCEKHGKPLVRLPGGYNPNQVAMQIVQQCGVRLATNAAASRFTEP